MLRRAALDEAASIRGIVVEALRACMASCAEEALVRHHYVLWSLTRVQAMPFLLLTFLLLLHPGSGLHGG